MLACRQTHRTQEVVGTEVGSLHSINVCTPTFVVEDFGKYRHSLFGCGVVVLESIGGILREVDFALEVDGCISPDVGLLCKIDNGNPLQVGHSKCINLLARGVDIAHTLDKPCSSVGTLAAKHLALRVDNIAGIHHIEHTLITLGEVVLDEVLVAGKFCSVITAYRAVEAGCCGIIEGADCKVQHSISQILVLQNLQIGLCGLYFSVTLRYKSLVREESHIDRHHICQNQHCHHRNQPLATHFAQSVEGYCTRSQSDEEERTPSIVAHLGHTLLDHC